MISESNYPERSIDQFLKPLLERPGLDCDWLGSFEISGAKYSLPRFRFQGRNNTDPLRIGLFAAIHGDEPAGALALRQFLLDLSGEPSPAESFQLQLYPICNPTGFEDGTRHSRRGCDLNREFWKGSAESEVEILEHELRTGHFHGIIQLHADDTSQGMYGFVRGHTLTENLLRPALCAAGQVLPRNVNATIDGFAARDGIIYDLYEGVLRAPAKMTRVPFEIILESPGRAPMDLQVQALLVALGTILSEYRRLMAFAANI